jgi:hypothetical protein
MVPYTRSYGSDEVEIPAGGKLHLRRVDDRVSGSFETRDLAVGHNETMRMWMDWMQRHIEQVYESTIHEMDGDKNITVSTEEGPEVGLREIGAGKLDEVTGGQCGETERLNPLLEGQDDQVRYVGLQIEDCAMLLEGRGDYTIETVFPRDMIGDAVEFICKSAIPKPDYRPRYKPQLQQNIVEVLEE